MKTPMTLKKHIKSIGIILTLGCGLVTNVMAKGPDKNTTVTSIDQPQLLDIAPIKSYPPILSRKHFASKVKNAHVLMEFDITPKGKVKNIVVVESQPKGLFDQAFKRALKKYKYPKSDTTRRSQQRIEFVLED